MRTTTFAAAMFLSTLIAILQPAHASSDTCSHLPDHAALRKALIEARHQDNGGFNLDMWGTIVDRSGVVCAVAYTGDQTGSQWLGSRVISAQKANTANAFSLPGLALSTANLYAAVQPGGPLFGLQESNPVSTEIAYAGDYANFGTQSDPMTGHRIGGINVFGGGLALYDEDGAIIGGLGVSGDSSCADHNIAWRARHSLNLDFVPRGVSLEGTDTIIFDMTDGKSASGFGHPKCGGTEDTKAAALPKIRSVPRLAE